MSTAMMFTRVSLLLLVTGLFAGMWSADSPDGRTPAQMQLARRASSPRSIGHGDARRRSMPIKNVSIAGRSVPVQLPRGIAAGTYLVVDQAGSTRRMTITAEETGQQDNKVPVEQYTVRHGDGRWHFIRLELPAERTTASPVSQARAEVRR